MTFRLQALVEHFKFFSEKLIAFAALFGFFQNFHLKNEKVVKTF
jgi:hypothetical protein